MAEVKAITRKDKDVAELFNQMLGADGSLNMNICYAKYANIKAYIVKLMKTFTLLGTSPALKKYDDLEMHSKEIAEFVESANRELAAIFQIEHNLESNLNALDDVEKKKFSEAYDLMKKSQIINVIMSVCNNLIQYRTHLNDTSKLDHKFIINMPGIEFAPFPFTQLNIKRLFIRLETDAYPNAQLSADDNAREKKVNEQLINLVMLMLNKVFVMSYNLFKEYSKPDIDVNEFVEVVKNNLNEVRKRIPRCNRAFNKIEESVNMLKDNFGSYYRDFIETKNNTIIMENFVMDVAKNTKADAQTTREFREIIKYYKNMAASQIKNPQLKMLFERVNENFQQLEKHSNISNAEREDKEESTRERREEIERKRAEERATSQAAESYSSEQQAAYETKSIDEIMADAGFTQAEINAQGKKPVRK